MSKIFCLGVAVLCASASASIAHDLRGLDDKSMQVARIVEYNRLGALASQTRNPMERYVLGRLVLWTPGQVLKSCFFDGASEAEIALTLHAVKTLLDGQNVNISFDFGMPPTYRQCVQAPGPNGFREDVRVSFKHGCCSGYVGITWHGKDAHDDTASVKIAGLIKPNASEDDKKEALRVATHELLHVLGLHHEHQSPAITCASEFNREDIMLAYGWNEEKYKTNIAQLDRDNRAYKWSDFDEDSMMRYVFEPWQLHNGADSPCYFNKKNFVPSPTDYEALRDAYPFGTRAADTLERTRSGAASLAASNLPAVLREYIDITRRLARE